MAISKTPESSKTPNQLSTSAQSSPSIQKTYFPKVFYGEDVLRIGKIMDREKVILRGRYMVIAEFNTQLIDLDHILSMDFEEEIDPILEELGEKTGISDFSRIKYGNKSAEVLLEDGRTITMYKPNGLQMAFIEEEASKLQKNPSNYGATLMSFKILACLTRDALTLNDVKSLPMIDINNMMEAQMKLMPEKVVPDSEKL